MNDLVAYVRAQLDVDEDDATQLLAKHGQHLTVARLAREKLADIAAKRAILDLHAGEHDCPEMVTGTYPADWPESAPWGKAGQPWAHPSVEHFENDQPCPTVRLLARPYAAREGWREEWTA